MPTFTTEVTATVDVDFEVFCSCGNGMCSATETRESLYRKQPQAVVEPCPKCLEEARKEAADEAADEVRDEMQQRIDELEAELENERRKLAA